MNKSLTPNAGAALPPFDYPPALRPCYAIRDGAAVYELERLLGIRLGHLAAMLAVGPASGQSAAYQEACTYTAQECRELFKQIQARREAE